MEAYRLSQQSIRVKDNRKVTLKEVEIEKKEDSPLSLPEAKRTIQIKFTKNFSSSFSFSRSNEEEEIDRNQAINKNASPYLQSSPFYQNLEKFQSKMNLNVLIEEWMHSSENTKARSYAISDEHIKYSSFNSSLCGNCFNPEESLYLYEYDEQSELFQAEVQNFWEDDQAELGEFKKILLEKYDSF